MAFSSFVCGGDKAGTVDCCDDKRQSRSPHARPDPRRPHGDTVCELLPALANRHGLVTGGTGTGTGKTIPLQTLAEGFGRIGVPVFLADVKGDLTGITQPGSVSPKPAAPLQERGLPTPVPLACPALLDMKDLRAMLQFVGDNAGNFTTEARPASSRRTRLTCPTPCRRDCATAQLRNRVQHARRAFSPRDQKAVKAAADTMRANPRLGDMATAIIELAVGEALVSLLDAQGRPSITGRVFVLPPGSQIGPITAAQRQALIGSSLVAGVYEKEVDRASAYES